MQEINLAALIQLVQKKWKITTIVCVSITLLGVIVVSTTPNVYLSTALLAPEQVDEKEQEEAIYPEIYPNIVGSTDFLLQLFNVEIRTADGSIITSYKEYLTHHIKSSILSYPLGWIYAIRQKVSSKPITISNAALEEFDNKPTMLSKSDEELLSSLRSSIACRWDKKTGVITIDVVDQDPLVAAIIATHVTIQLQEAITDYRTRKTRFDLDYAQQIYDETYQAYQQAQNEYATYTDAYSHATLESYKIQQESLKQTVELHFKTFSDAKIKLQEAKMKLQENTPAFYTFQQASIAGLPSGTSPLKKIFKWFCIGIICGLGFAVLTEYIKHFHSSCSK